MSRTGRRVGRAIKRIEQSGARGVMAGQPTRHTYHAWWGITKERINNGQSGDVYMVQGSPMDPTQSTIVYEVANPYMGDLLVGHPILAVLAIVKEKTSAEVWHVAPFELMYEAKASGTIAAGSSGTWRVWHDTDSGQDITAHLRWVPAARSASSGQQARIKWDIFKQRFYVDSMDC
jgi:hypothetical protein